MCNNKAREMKVSSFDDGEDSEHTGDAFFGIFQICAPADMLCIIVPPLDGAHTRDQFSCLVHVGFMGPIQADPLCICYRPEA